MPDEVTLSEQSSAPPNKLSSPRLTSTIPAALTGPVGLATALLAKDLDPQDYEAWDKAESYYERVRECAGDVDVIATNTPYNSRQVQRIKDHLFYDTHILDEGEARFDADPLIANTWSRLQRGSHGPKDLQLMEHELFESRFEDLFHTDYRTAHQAADRSGRPSGLYD